MKAPKKTAVSGNGNGNVHRHLETSLVLDGDHQDLENKLQTLVDNNNRQIAISQEGTSEIVEECTKAVMVLISQLPQIQGGIQGRLKFRYEKNEGEADVRFEEEQRRREAQGGSGKGSATILRQRKPSNGWNSDWLGCPSFGHAVRLGCGGRTNCPRRPCTRADWP